MNEFLGNLAFFASWIVGTVITNAVLYKITKAKKPRKNKREHKEPEDIDSNMKKRIRSGWNKRKKNA